MIIEKVTSLKGFGIAAMALASVFLVGCGEPAAEDAGKVEAAVKEAINKVKETVTTAEELDLDPAMASDMKDVMTKHDGAMELNETTLSDQLKSVVDKVEEMGGDLINGKDVAVEEGALALSDSQGIQDGLEATEDAQMAVQDGSGAVSDDIDAVKAGIETVRDGMETLQGSDGP